MIPNEYQMHDHHKELLRQAEQHRLAREWVGRRSLSQRAGQMLLKFGARLAVAEPSECYTVASKGQLVTVCAA